MSSKNVFKYKVLEQNSADPCLRPDVLQIMLLKMHVYSYESP